MERWIARVFVSAALRRVAALLVVAVLAWLGIGSARAQDVTGCASRDHTLQLCPSVAAALSGMESAMNQQCAVDLAAGYRACPERIVTAAQCTPLDRGTTSHDCKLVYVAKTASGQTTNSRTVSRRVIKDQCPPGEVLNPYTGKCGISCSSRPSQSTLFLPPGGSTRCNDGCEQKYTWMGANSEGKETTRTDYTGAVCNPDTQKDDCNARNPGGTTPPTWAWNGYLGVCQPIATECPAGQSATPDGKCKNNDECPISHVLNASGVCVKKEEQCPPGNVKSPEGKCLPGDGQCAAGEALGKDGTCKRDTDGDGVPDSDQDPNDPDNNQDGKQFSGGDTCNAPPTCSGDPILCGQSRIQWRIDCNTRSRATIEGGACDRMPVCSGDGCKPMEHAQLIQQWKAACALERMAKGGEGGGNPLPGDGDGLKEHLTAMKQAEVDALNALGTDDGHTGVDESKIWKTFGNGDFNPNLFGGSGGGQCSFNLELMGHSIDPGPGFWTLAGMIGWFVVACAYLWVAFKLGG